MDEEADKAIIDEMLETARIAQVNEDERTKNWGHFKSSVDAILDNIQADIRMAAANEGVAGI